MCALAAMLAGHQKLANLIGIVDRNRLSATGFTEDIVALEPFADKWRAFGWHVVEVDGHDYPALIETFAPLFAMSDEGPTSSFTFVGKEMSFMN